MSILTLSIRQISKMLALRQISAYDVCQEFLNRIADQEPYIRAFLKIRPAEAVLLEAQASDDRRSKGKGLTALAGIPIVVKDNIAVEGLGLTCGSRILETFTCPYDATAVERIRGSGMIMIGKTNMDEFGMGSSTENSSFFTTRNPHDLSLVPGGTSGGSAAAVAAFEAPIALGSDTGGSIRQPASFCGVVGLKPSYGRVSRFGLVAYASSLDTVGILARDVLDSAHLLSVIAGQDRLDSTSSSVPPEEYHLAAVQRSKLPFRVGVPVQYISAAIDKSIRDCLGRSLDKLRDDGCDIIEVSLPSTEAALQAYYVIASCEASSNLARYDGMRYGYSSSGRKSFSDTLVTSRSEGFGSEVKRRIMLGTFALSHGHRDAYYDRARRIRASIAQDFREAFERCDILFHPVSPTLPWKVGQKSMDPLRMYLSDALSVPASLAGLPAIVLPCGFSPEGLPIGLQATGPHMAESLVIAFALRLEALVATSPAVIL